MRLRNAENKSSKRLNRFTEVDKNIEDTLSVPFDHWGIKPSSKLLLHISNCIKDIGISKNEIESNLILIFY